MNTKVQIYKYKYTNTNTQIRIHKYEYTSTIKQIKIHKYKYINTQIHKYTNTNTQIPIHKYQYTNSNTHHLVERSHASHVDPVDVEIEGGAAQHAENHIPLRF